MKTRVLQLFNRYLQYGGEEGSVLRIGDALQEICDVGYFLSSSEKYTKGATLDFLKGPLVSLHNSEVMGRLSKCQSLGGYEVWQIHNTFPFMSPSVYGYAFQNNIPVIQYLHNYRMSCVNGYFLNHGKHCTSCIGGNFTKAALTGCWRDSRIVSGWAGLILTRMRSLGVFDNVSAWIALSRKQKEIHVSMGIPEERIHLIPHFYEIDPKRLIHEQGKDVLFIGRLSDEKGVHLLLDAWKIAGRAGSSLIYMGDGPELIPLKNRVSAEGIRNVRFLGFVKKEDQSEIWRQSAFAVVPSIWEDPLPTTVFESWERGRTVIASAMGGNRETVDHGETGMKFRNGDVQEFADAISFLLDSPAECVRMAAKGLEVLTSCYKKDDWMAKMRSVYRHVTKK
jgi:glycosyltransferase involved in cell wall biosynthesis